MKKIILAITSTFTLFLIFTFSATGASPSPEASISPTPEPVSSNELFWPISPGKVSGESMFGLKLFKEKFRLALIFNAPAKVKYYTTLSTKRLVESEKLYLSKKDYVNAKKSLELSIKNRSEAFKLLDQTQKSGKDAGDSKGVLKDTLEKQKKLLEYLQTEVPDSEKEYIGKVLQETSETANSL